MSTPKLTTRTIRRVFAISQLTQGQFAKEVKARRETVNLWLKGKQHPDLHHIKRITILAAKLHYHIVPDLTAK